jgi:PAS domain S-box-containing protein
MSGEVMHDAGFPLRRMAEERVANREQHTGPLEPAEMAKALHELMVHQVELETQNEELIATRSELEANTKLLTDLYDFAPVGYLSLNSKGLIRQVNFMAARMLGRERGLLLDEDFTQFVTPENRRDSSEFVSRVFADDSTQLCELALLQQGQPNMIVSLKGGLSPNGLVCRLAIIDITEQRRVEAAVREKNEDLDRIFNLSHDLLGIADHSGHFRRVNPEFERVLGYSCEELTSQKFLSFIHPDDLPTTLNEVSRLKAGEQVMDFANRYRCADGTYRWLEWRGVPYGDGLMCAVARDITDRKKAMEALRRSEEKFRSIIETSPTAFHTYQLQNDNQLILMSANASADKELGINHAAFIGMTLEAAFPKLMETDVPTIYRKIAKGELGAQRLDIRYEDNESGISGFFEVHAFQTNPGIIGVEFSDISERRMAQEELEIRVRRRTAELQQRKAELRALADELSHAEEFERQRIALVIHEDLQQMLVAALLNLGMLKSKVTDAEVLREFGHIEEMIRDSVKTARALTAELSPPILRQSGLTAAFEWLQKWCGEKYGLEVRLDIEEAAQPSIDASVTAFRCVRELLFNIVKHAGTQEAGLRMWLTDDEIIKIEVSDAGCGFDPEIIREREGSNGGFGLMSIRKRMEWLGGGLEIESSLGTGSHFTLWFPLKSMDHAEPNKYRHLDPGTAKS